MISSECLIFLDIFSMCLFYFQIWYQFSLFCLVNQSMQTKFFVKVCEWICLSHQNEMNQLEMIDTRNSHTASPHSTPTTNKTHEVCQTAQQFKFIEAKMVIIKPQYFTCALNLFVISISFFWFCHYFWFTVENKVVTDKTRDRGLIDSNWWSVGWWHLSHKRSLYFYVVY